MTMKTEQVWDRWLKSDQNISLDCKKLKKTMIYPPPPPPQQKKMEM